MNPPHVVGPDGAPWTLAPPASPDQTLADWLADNGHFLNTRCGKRGLCRGCRVETATGDSLPACGCTVESLSRQTLHIPPASVRNATLTGVTAFDLEPEPGRTFTLPGGPGLALDIGTTTLAGALWTGDPPLCSALATRPNPQIRFGDNVVSRVQFALDHPDNPARLHRTLITEGILPLIQDLCTRAGLAPADIVHITAAGPGIIGRLDTHPDCTWMLPETPVPWRAMAGAAYVDFMAIGRRQGWISPMGRLEPGSAGHAVLTESVSVTEADLAELLQAKAAIQAGWTTLLECAGIGPSDLEEVIVAGGFGYHLTPAHAVAIGLLPPVPPDRIRLAGNASLAGASLALLTPAILTEWEDHCRAIRVIELNQQDSFEDHYIDALNLEAPPDRP